VNPQEQAFRRIVAVLEKLNLPFLVGGSLASSIHGIYRTTADIDLVVELSRVDVQRFVAELGPDFYADADSIQELLSHSRSFNVIHKATGYKFDLFPRSRDAFQDSQFERRALENASTTAEPLLVPVASAEDTILTKLVWYRAGGQVSDRQWNDIRGIISVQGDRLDREYLHKWARYLEIDDLLERVLSA
jgi:hypothetical protein